MLEFSATGCCLLAFNLAPSARAQGASLELFLKFLQSPLVKLPVAGSIIMIRRLSVARPQRSPAPTEDPQFRTPPAASLAKSVGALPVTIKQ